jgi:GxxExxY protein
MEEDDASPDSMPQNGFSEIPDEMEAIGKQIVDAAFTVHKKLGPGLLESVYEICLAHELEKRGLKVKRKIEVSVVYDGIRILKAYELDLLVNDCIVIELKAVDKLHPVHSAQLLTYLKLSNHRLGFLINFNEALIRDGIKRKVM